MRHLMSYALLLGRVVGSTPSLGAQTYSPAQCSTIIGNALSHPANRDTLALVEYCPNAFGPTIASLLQDQAVYADSALYDEVVWRATRRQEPELFTAALSIAQDAGATRLQRLSAIQILIKYFSPAAETNVRGMPQSFARVDLCTLGGGRQAAAGENPLPANARATALGVATAIGNAPGPDAVRVLAHCLIAATTINPDYIDPPGRPNTNFTPATDFQVQVLCGRRLQLSNTSYAAVSLRLVWGDNAAQITANNQARDYTLPGRTITNPVFQTVWQVPSSTALKFRIQQLLNGWGGPPYVLLVSMETLNTTACP